MVKTNSMNIAQTRSGEHGEVGVRLYAVDDMVVRVGDEMSQLASLLVPDHDLTPLCVSPLKHAHV